MKITLFTKDTNCDTIIAVQACHITIFGGNKIKIHFPKTGNTCSEEQMKFIDTCIKNFIHIEVQGGDVSLIPENNNFQRVYYRFD